VGNGQRAGGSEEIKTAAAYFYRSSFCLMLSEEARRWIAVLARLKVISYALWLRIDHKYLY
jgi:hypothetical protein